MGGLLGGSSKSSSGGFGSLPSAIKNTYTGFANDLSPYISNPSSLTSMYTPIGQTSNETQAINSITNGLTPTSSSLNSTLSMLQNPYNQSVIDEINRQSQGQNSVLQQNLNNAGQLGSNRQMLGANDIDLSRTNQIGSFLQGQYNTNLGYALNQIPQLQQQDITNNLAAGQFQRGLASQQQQAPLTGLAALSQILGVLPTNSGQSQSSQTGGLGSTIGGLGSAGLGAALAFSDKRLKENIVPVDMQNGHRVYQFNYKGDDKKYIGVMAQEVEKTMPEAVDEVDGVKRVNYAMIGVKFREAKNG